MSFIGNENCHPAFKDVLKRLQRPKIIGWKSRSKDNVRRGKKFNFIEPEKFYKLAFYTSTPGINHMNNYNIHRINT